jgi:hypothetical protein
MGFNKMTPVQASTISLFMGNKDVVVEVRLFLPCMLEYVANYVIRRVSLDRAKPWHS